MTPDAESPSASAPPPARKSVLSRRKKWLFALATLIVLVPSVELVSWAGLKWEESSFPDPLTQLYQDQQQLADSGVAATARSEVLHPYMGWSLNPQTRPEVEIADRRIAVNWLGFADDGPSVFKRSADRFVVGIAGGSVAQQMGVLGADALRRRLSESKRLRGRKIELVRMAFQGFKQPQQLMALNYVLSLGGELDAVVNVDGFNEVALPPCENREFEVSAAYPRMWSALTSDIVDPRQYADAFRMLSLRARRQEAARAIVASPFRFSPTRNLLWKIHDLYLENEIASLGETMLMARKSIGRGFATSGPDPTYHNDDELYEQLGEIWRNSSLQMDVICRGNGTIYVHALQPNQYVPGSKPMGPAEAREAIDESRCFAVAVRKAYPILQRQGEKLRKAGVDFRDLTRLFASVPGPIYADNCCHYNKEGYELLATALADEILLALDRRGS
jgi:hypothetical protein